MTLLRAENITKTFPGVVAVRNVTFDLNPGEIHALCGENGAGKSTLIKLLSGIHPYGSYEGNLTVDGRPARFASVAEAEAAGIAVIYQELALVPEMTVAENLFLGSEPCRRGLIQWDQIYRDARRLLEDFHLKIDPAHITRNLGTGHKQLLEILKALRKNSRILILDEPTAALTETEVDTLLSALKKLRQRGTGRDIPAQYRGQGSTTSPRGIGCIYISHKLDEVLAIADRITVLRDGASVATFKTKETNKNEIIKHMVGHEINDFFPRRTSKPKEILLNVRGLTVAGPEDQEPFLKNISFEVRAGEVLGFGGLMGSGRTELLMHLFGAWGRRLSGTVELIAPSKIPSPLMGDLAKRSTTSRMVPAAHIGGREGGGEGGDTALSPHLNPLPQGERISLEMASRSFGPREAIRRGLVLVTEDRRRYGLVPEHSVGFNLSLSSLPGFTRKGLIDFLREFKANKNLCESLRVKAAGLDVMVAGLSGGNQQKIVIGKTLMTEPRIIFMDEPTRGIDVGAKLEVYEIINRLTEAGKAVVLVSSELPELMGMSDRILMLHEGTIGGSFGRREATQEKLMAAAMGQGAGMTV